jgi:hypothetical protein
MKFRLLVVVCLILIITSCSKSGGSSGGSGGGTPTPTLTATETSMLGTWYLKRERLVQKLGSMVTDTLFTSFNNIPYIELKSTPYSYAGVSGWDVNSKNYTDNAYLQAYSNNYLRGSMTIGGAWYVDANTGFLIVSLVPYKFSVNSKDLTLSSSQNIGGVIILDTLFFQK